MYTQCLDLLLDLGITPVSPFTPHYTNVTWMQHMPNIVTWESRRLRWYGRGFSRKTDGMKLNIDLNYLRYYGSSAGLSLVLLKSNFPREWLNEETAQVTDPSVRSEGASSPFNTSKGDNTSKLAFSAETVTGESCRSSFLAACNGLDRSDTNHLLIEVTLCSSLRWFVFMSSKIQTSPLQNHLIWPLEKCKHVVLNFEWNHLK